MTTVYTTSPPDSLGERTPLVECATALALVSIATSLERLTTQAEATRETNTAKIDALLRTIDLVATNYDAAWGLPLHVPEPTDNLRAAVRAWLTEVHS